MYGAVAAIIACFSLTACFGPSFGVLACSETVGCPDDLVCVDGFCAERGVDGTEDAGVDGASAFSMTDDDADDFAEGEFFLTTHDGMGVVPTAEYDGRFISRVFDSGEAATRWTSFAFTPSAPYGKPLPDNAETEAGYREGNADMTGNRLLLHCEESADSTLDTSGRGHVVEPIAGSSLQLRNGVLGDSCLIGDNQTFQIPITASGGLSTGESDYTWMMWVRTSTSCTGNDVFMGMDANLGSNVGSHQWIGCARNETNSTCGSGVTGSVAGTHRVNQADAGGGFCGTPSINDNEWHHIALVKAGHASYQQRVYLDGELIETETGGYSDDFVYQPGDNLTFGTFPDPGFDTTSGRVDEVAIFTRALSDEEVTALFERGGSSVRVRVRTCSDPDCADVSFGDAAGDESSFIIDPPSALAPPEPVMLTLPAGRYFQYDVQFSRRAGATPRFEAATVTGIRAN